ncbi:hypothetical protein [Streptosporangium sp. 'caverna']|uniref:hypothetical protein n=1 Tax=Streptosporangium sp. 'caverna' TaxID=2202249 RepID=UPI0013A6C798|nr:hypothetical protein [Streptosporangium sp. 'caverna']
MSHGDRAAQRGPALNDERFRRLADQALAERDDIAEVLPASYEEQQSPTCKSAA